MLGAVPHTLCFRPASRDHRPSPSSLISVPHLRLPSSPRGFPQICHGPTPSFHRAGLTSVCQFARPRGKKRQESCFSAGHSRHLSLISRPPSQNDRDERAACSNGPKLEALEGEAWRCDTQTPKDNPVRSCQALTQQSPLAPSCKGSHRPEG